MLTKGAVRDNLPQVARGAALHDFKMAPHVKTGSIKSCYKQSLVEAAVLRVMNRFEDQTPETGRGQAKYNNNKS